MGTPNLSVPLGQPRKAPMAARPDCVVGSHYRARGRPLRANIDETVLLVVITEQGENRNQCEEQRNLFGRLMPERLITPLVPRGSDD